MRDLRSNHRSAAGSAKKGVTFFCLLILVASHAGAADIPPTFKCRDRSGRITYSNVRCAEQGLQDAGKVPTRITVVPAPARPLQAPKRDRREPKRAASVAKEDADGRDEATGADTRDDDEGGRAKPAGRFKPVNPIVERLLR